MYKFFDPSNLEHFDYLSKSHTVFSAASAQNINQRGKKVTNGLLRLAETRMTRKAFREAGNRRGDGVPGTER